MMPVVRNSRALIDIVVAAAIVATSMMKKQPTTLTIRVPQGNAVQPRAPAQSATRKRRPPPSALPAQTTQTLTNRYTAGSAGTRRRALSSPARGGDRGDERRRLVDRQCDPVGATADADEADDLDRRTQRHQHGRLEQRQAERAVGHAAALGHRRDVGERERRAPPAAGPDPPRAPPRSHPEQTAPPAL